MTTRRRGTPPAAGGTQNGNVDAHLLLGELVKHSRQNRTQLLQQWVERIRASGFLGAKTQEELFNEATSVYDNYLSALETGSTETLHAYARELSERIMPLGVETDGVLGILLLLRDVLSRHLLARHQADYELLNRVLDAYEPAANRITNKVVVSFVQERERFICQQQEAIAELSTPVLLLRDRLLLAPIIGIVDTERARQLTEQLLEGIRVHRARVVVMDITGVPAVDSKVANHLIQTVEAAGLMGATVVISGMSAEVAQAVVSLGVDFSRFITVGDLKSAFEETSRILRYRIVQEEEPART
jgi:rsbT co-antagonist protein RsbR